MPKLEGTVTIDAQEYLTLLERSFDLQCLENNGVDNWSGYGEGECREREDDAMLLKMVKAKMTA